jgi:membrane protein YdbS with pleckstrin-like domain
VSQHVDAAAVWIYRGVWASVVSLFRVPPHPPTLPASGEAVRSLRPAPGYLRYLKFIFWVMLVPGDAVPLAIWVAISVAFPALGILLAVPCLILVIAPDIVAYIAIHLRYDTTWYVLTDRSLRIRRGIWVIHETTISFENVQNVEMRQGPLQRVFGIADVIVQTAGGGAQHGSSHGSTSPSAHVGILQGLDDAEAVRDQILDRVMRTRSAGLGDERTVPPVLVHQRNASMLSPSHLAVLRDIAATARRMERPGSGPKDG